MRPFTARVPRAALEHFARFAEVLRHFGKILAAAAVSRSCLPDAGPCRRGRTDCVDYRGDRRETDGDGHRPQIAKTVAQSSRFRAHQDSTHREA